MVAKNGARKFVQTARECEAQGKERHDKVITALDAIVDSTSEQLEVLRKVFRDIEKVALGEEDDG